MNTNASIIIPAFNSVKTLEKCLQSIIASIEAGDEIIVVDDASTDHTAEMAKKYGCVVITLLRNNGAAHARNQGAQAASNSLFIFVDSDVLIKKSDVDKVKKYFYDNTDVQTITTNVEKEFIRSNFYSDFKNLYMNYVISESETSVNYIYGSFCATRKKGYVSWPENLRMTEDSLWGYLQKSQGLEIHCLKDIQVKHLKEYSFKSLIKNDFDISYYFARSFLKCSRWKTLYSEESFGHTSKKQKLSVLSAALAVISLIFSPALVVIALASILLLNIKFLKYLTMNRGLFFSLKSYSWLLIAYCVYFLGIGYGTIKFITQKVATPEQEIA